MVVQPKAEMSFDPDKDQRLHNIELAQALDRHVLHRQKLAVVMEREFAQICGGGSDDEPEEAAVRTLRFQSAQIATQASQIAKHEKTILLMRVLAAVSLPCIVLMMVIRMIGTSP